jgi:hypothetical protein
VAEVSETVAIPVTVRLGVTGHRTLPGLPAVRRSVKAVLRRLDQILAHTPHT